MHPTAQIDPQAQIGAEVEIGPFVVIEADVTVGAGSRLLTGTLLQRGSRVGADCVLGPYAVLGSLPMDSAFRGEDSLVELGDRVQVRDFATIHRASGEGAATMIGADTLIMSSVHVSHNVRVGEGAVVTSGSQLGGHSSVGDFAVLGASAHLHQFVRVGTMAMIGAMSGLNRDALPFSLMHGVFAEHYGLNRIGLKRRGISGERFRMIEQAYRALRRREHDRFSELALGSDDVRLMQEFLATGSRGLSRFRGAK